MSLDDEPNLFDLGSALLTEKSPDNDSGTPVKNSNERPNLRDTMSRGEAEITESADDDSPESSDDTSEEADELQVESGETESDESDDDQQQQEQDDIVFARAAAMGLDLKSKYGGNKEAAIDGLLHAARLVGQRNQLAEYGKQLLENPQAVLASLEKLYKKPEPETKVEKKSDVPEFDPAWREMIDEEGKPLPGVDPAIPLKLKKYYEFIRNRAEQMARDPESVIMPTLEEKIKKMVDERASAIARQEADRLREEQTKVNVAREAQALVQEEASWAFVDGDISKGPTDEGRVLGKWLQILETPDESGNIPIPNLRMRKEVAVMMARQELGTLKAKDNSAERKVRQEKITKKNNRSANVTSKTWPKGLTLEEALLRSYDKQ